jgi:hypothetical protein
MCSLGRYAWVHKRRWELYMSHLRQLLQQIRLFIGLALVLVRSVEISVLL